MAASFLKQKRSLSFGLNYTSKIRPSDPPFRQTLPGSFPWQDKASQTELSLILDVEKTLAILASLQEELASIREELKLAKEYLQSEYEILLETKAMDLTRRINEGLFFLESAYKERVEGLKHAFRQQMLDYLHKELALKSKRGDMEIPGIEEESLTASLDIEQLRILERELREKLKARDTLVESLENKLRHYVQQQHQLFAMQQSNQIQLVQLRGQLRKREEIYFYTPKTPEDEEDVERAYNFAKLGAMHNLKMKHKSEINALKSELEKFKAQTLDLQKVLEMKEMKLTTFKFEMTRMKTEGEEMKMKMYALQTQLQENEKAIENERAEATRLITEMKNKLVQEAERQERRRKWQMFMQDPTKLLAGTKQPTPSQTSLPLTADKLREEVIRMAFEGEYSVEVLSQIMEIMKRSEEGNSSSRTLDFSGEN